METGRQMLDEITLTKSEIQNLNQNLIEEINLMKNEIRQFNQNMVDQNNSTKNAICNLNQNLIEEINLMKNEIRLFNQNILHENACLKNEIKSKEELIDNLLKKIEVINQQFNPKLKTEEADLPTNKGNITTDIEKALIKKSFPAVKYYIEQNPAMINQKFSCGRTPLHIASELGCFDIVIFLISKGADIEAFEDFNNNTPLIQASGYGHPLVVKFLLDNKANINYQNNYGSTPLHHAVWGNHLDVVKLLIELKANKSLRNNNGQNPLDVAKSYNATCIISYLSSV